MSDLRVRTAQIGALSEQLSASAAALAEAREQLVERAQDLYWQWHGDGADAFHARVDVLARDMEGREKALTAAAHMAAQLEDLYASADVNLARLFGDS